MLEFILKNWRFTESSPPIIYGNVFGNPRFIDGIYIHTSSVQQVTMDPDRKLFLISTKSGSTYLLPFDSMSIPYNEINKKQIENLSQEQIDSVWSDIITFSKESLEKQKEAMEQRIENFKEKSEKGSLYLEFIGNELEKAIFHRYDTDKDVPEFYEVKKHVHVGMFQDSVLVTDWENGLVDYRYFPLGDAGIETYHWSDGLEYIWVHNMTGDTIDFDGTQIAGMSYKIIEKGKAKEGLFSPDAVNGKSLLTEGG